MELCHIGQAGLKFLASSDLPTLASPSAGITGVSLLTQPQLCLFSTLLRKVLGVFIISFVVMISQVHAYGETYRLHALKTRSLVFVN